MTSALAHEPDTAAQLRGILVPTDFSPAANVAVSFAADRARRHGATLHIAHSVWMHSFNASLDTSSPTLFWSMRVGQEELDSLDHSRLLAGIPHEVHLLPGPPEVVMPQFARTHDIDLAIVGASGRSGVGRLLLGSTSERMLRALDCPVMTLGPQAWSTRHVGDFRSLLLAVDVAEDDNRRPAELTSQLVQEYRAQLTLLHVLQPGGPKPGMQYEAAARKLREFIPRDVAFWTPPDAQVEIGDPAETILRVAAEVKADLVVLGARSGGFYDHARNVANTVVCNATCPVLTVRH